MAKNNIWKENKTPPLEYCSLSRATELLSCRIEDIMHWFICGDIYLSASIANVYGYMDMVIIDDSDPRHVFSDFSPSSFSYFNALSPIRYHHKNGEAQRVSIGGGVDGIWRFNVWNCYQSHKHFNISDGSIIRPMIDSIRDEDFNITFRVAQGGFQMEDSDLLIDRVTIETLHYCAANGLRVCEVDEDDIFNYSSESHSIESLCDKEEQEDKDHPTITNEIKKHGNSKRHQENRESLYKAAIYILSKYPSECRGSRKEISPDRWKDAIKAHQKEIPVLHINNDDVILRHLRNAVNLKMYGAE